MAFLPAMAETVQGGGAGGGVGLIKRCSPGTGGVGGLCWCRGRSWLGGVGGKADVPTRAFEPGQEVSLVGGRGGTSSFPRTFRRLNAAGKSCERTRGGTTDKERDLG